MRVRSQRQPAREESSARGDYSGGKEDLAFMSQRRRTRRSWLKSTGVGGLTLGAGAFLSGRSAVPGRAGPIDVGSRRQLFLDDYWFDRSWNTRLTLHRPIPREVALESDRPWEEEGIHYSSVVHSDGRYQMCYRAGRQTCYAESGDGVRWIKPNLGLYSFQGSGNNNILGGAELHNASQILDPNEPPGSPGRYKMIASSGGLRGYVSPDGIGWKPVRETPLVTSGPFDSHNTLLWDDERGLYVIYMRGVDTSTGGPVMWDPEGRRYVHNRPEVDKSRFRGGRRAIRRCESQDFLHWSEPEMVLARDLKDPANLHHYTNAAVNYFRAARSFLMFPMVFYVRDDKSLAYQTGLSDVQLASSRDGVHWLRPLRKPFLSPGPDQRNWVDRNPIMGQGVVPTGRDEISMYYTELYRSPECRLRRCSLRNDGFVSVDGPYEGWGEFTTRPIVFSGSRLGLNYSTSGGGGLRVELQDETGAPLPGVGMKDCPRIAGDRTGGIVRWEPRADLSRFAGRPVRLRIRLRDAHLYAFRFH